MKLTSTAFEDEGRIPKEYTADGANVSPPLAWTDAPDGAKAFALSVMDPDAPGGDFVHWLLYDIPEHKRDLTTGIPNDEFVLASAKQGLNDFGDLGYGGPAPPAPAEHRYVFELTALDDLTRLKPGAGPDDLRRAMEGHVLAIAKLTGRYKR